jgi:FkbM family methyltransferase
VNTRYALAAQLLPPRVRAAAWQANKAQRRWRRNRLERAGDYSQSYPAWHGLDAILRQFLDFDGGFFVEAGALDGYTQSNTYALERVRGWRGLLAEPVPHYAREAARTRTRASVFNCALVDNEFAASEIDMTFRGALTVTTERLGNDGSRQAWEQGGRPWEAPEYDFTVPARTLTSLLDEVGVADVDFLSLDVEGFEAQVLRGLDFERHAPKIILVEAQTDDRRERAIADTLGKKYEEIMRPTALDILYRRVG